MEEANKRINQILAMDEEDYTDAYELIGRKRGCLVRGNEVDYNKVSSLIIRDLREGYLGKVTFDE